MSTPEDIFNPRSIVIAGASGEPNNPGRMFLDVLLGYSFPGPIYPVNPRGGEILGRKVYMSIKDIPGPVDYVITSIPARYTIAFMRECAEKRVKVVQLFTAGFGEMHEEGARLQAELVKTAAQGGVRVLGPNCMGLYCPKTRLSFAPDLPEETGNAAFVSQSGGHAFQFIKMAGACGIRFSKVVSYGNAADLNETDFLEYCGRDPDTGIIVAYIEGVRDGRRFLSVLKETARAKPTIIIKGGQTAAGNRTIASHTGSLMGNKAVWDSIFKQTQAIRADSLEEAIDIMLILKFLPDTRGRNVGIVGAGGGASVQAADDCERGGLHVPAFSEERQAELRQFILFSSAAGSIFINPVDSPLAVLDGEKVSQILGVMATFSELDLLFGFVGVQANVLGADTRNVLISISKAMTDFGKLSPKPVIVITHHTVNEFFHDVELAIRNYGLANRLPVYPSVYRAARAISLAIEYNERKRRMCSDFGGKVA